MGRIGYDLHAIDHHRPLPQVERFSRHLGGSSANIAVGLARLGLQVGMISCLGKDALAEYLVGFLKHEGVDTGFVREAEGYNTSLCLTEVCPPSSFHQVFYRQNPADSQIEVGEPERSYIRTSKLFLANGTGLAASPARESTIEALKLARASGIQTFLDVDYRASSWRSSIAAGKAVADVLSSIDVLLANEEEMVLVTETSSLDEQADFVLSRGVKIAVCKLGAKGVRAYTAEEQYFAGPIPVKIISSIGAGDGFAAGFLAALYRGLPVGEALWHGNAAAAVVVSRVSCSDAMPYPEELEEYLKAAPVQSRAGRAPA